MPRLTNKPLTQRILDATPLPATGFMELRDATVRGLVVRIYPSGARTFSLEFRSPMTKKTARAKLAALTLTEARTQANAKKAIIAEGRDPNIERRETITAARIEYARAKDVAEAVRLYELDFMGRGEKMVSRRERMAKLRRAVEPFDDRQVASLTKAEFISRLDIIGKESGPVARNRAQAEIRAWLGWLHERDHVPAIALAGVKKRGIEKTRTRVLTDAELAAIVTATTDGSAFSDIIRVLLVTGMRKSEAANLQQRDLDWAHRRIRVRDVVAKNNQQRYVPMVEAIVPMLMARSVNLPAEGYIFGDGSGFRSPFSGWGKCTDRLRTAMPEGEPWTLHDIRRTVATRLHDAGVDTLVIEDLLGHLSGVRRGVAGVYNRAETLAKQHAALSAWVSTLAIDDDPRGNVVPFKRTV